ncbi:MAG: MgtC/SapB family protein, partial [Candidatus Scatosoma sp.]
MNDIIAKLLGEWCIGYGLGGVAFKLTLSVLLAAIVGCERATKRHAAGLRTFMLVSMISTLAATVDGYILKELGANFSFVIGATVIGLAVISSNTILYSSKNRLKGLTTSVALWGMCLISVLIGLDLYTAAIVSFAAFMICLVLFMKVEYGFKRRSDHFEIHLELKNKTSLQDFIGTVRKLGLKIDDIELNTAYMNSGLYVYSIALSVVSGEFKKFVKHDDVIAALSGLEYVNYVEE